LSQQPGIQVQAVAQALDIHPFMLSRWRKLRVPAAREMRRLQELERAHALLQEEHDLLKAIRFCSVERKTSSRSSRPKRARSR
jgi:transposase